MKVLSTKTKGGQRRINVVRYGDEHTFTCYGAAAKENSGVSVYVNHMKYFDSTEE
ncbi:MAG: hypothetical protein GX045_05965 [Clostridiaceae bacterium]|nr:hypothetical protein [Clostridiaceae bacterium]